MEESKYFQKDNKICRIKVEQDIMPLNPREDFEPIGHMMCWHNSYRLGDNHDYRDPEAFLDDMIRKHYSTAQIIRLAKAGKLQPNIELLYDKAEKEWQLWADCISWHPTRQINHSLVASDTEIDFLVDDVIECISMSDKIKMLEKKGFIFFPLAIYDHSGITMYIGDRFDHFDGPWDCSNVGWIYTTKEEFSKIGEVYGLQYRAGNGRYYPVTSKNWKKGAETILIGEVEEYDMYLTGDVYGYILEEYDTEALDWNETYACWGYFSKKWGDDLIKELALEAIGEVPLYDSVEDLRQVA